MTNGWHCFVEHVLIVLGYGLAINYFIHSLSCLGTSSDLYARPLCTSVVAGAHCKYLPFLNSSGGHFVDMVCQGLNE